MAEKKVDPGELTRQAWEMIEEAMTSGTMTLTSNKTMPLDSKTFVELVKWLANMDKKRKYVPKPEDFLPAKTGGRQ